MVSQAFNQKQQDKILRINGYHKIRSTGSHIVFKNANGHTIILANHGKGVKPTVFDQAIKKYKLIIP